MPVSDHRQVEFRAQFENTPYPFADSASLSNGSVFFGEHVFVDAAFYVIGAGQRLHISRVTIRNEQSRLVIGDERGPERASVSFDTVNPPDSLRLTDTFGRPAGLLVSDAARLSTFQSWPLGTHVFTVAQTEFAARCCIPTPEVGLRGFLLDDGSVLTDDVWIIGEDGVVVRAEELEVDVPGSAETEIQQVLRIDVVGDPLFRRRLCGNVFVTPRFLRSLTIRHGCEKVKCGPDEHGDIKISVTSHNAPDTVLRVRTVEGGLVFELVGERLETPRR